MNGPLRALQLIWMLSSLMPLIVESKVWNAQELAVGEWDVRLRGGWHFSPWLLFSGKPTANDTSISVIRRPWGSSLDCTLSLCQDGTFSLMPKSGSHLSLQGYWDVLANPYCITDRFYDQLQMQSYPRVKVKPMNRKKAILDTQLSRIDFSSRIWGRYRKSKGIGRKGSMTHGTMVWNELLSPDSSWTRPRRVVASFSAKRCRSEPQRIGSEDMAFFGY